MNYIRSGVTFDIELFKNIIPDNKFYTTLGNKCYFTTIHNLKYLQNDLYDIYECALPNTGQVYVDLPMYRITNANLVIEKIFLPKVDFSTFETMTDFEKVKNFALTYYKHYKFRHLKLNKKFTTFNCEQLINYIFDNIDTKNKNIFLDYCNIDIFKLYFHDFSCATIYKICNMSNEESLNKFLMSSLCDPLVLIKLKNCIDMILKVFLEKEYIVKLKLIKFKTLIKLDDDILNNILLNNCIKKYSNKELNKYFDKNIDCKEQLLLFYIKKPSSELQSNLLKFNSNYLRHINNIDQNLIKDFLLANKHNIFYIKYITKELFDLYISRYSKLSLHKNHKFITNIITLPSYLNHKYKSLLSKFDKTNYLTYWNNYNINNSYDYKQRPTTMLRYGYLLKENDYFKILEKINKREDFLMNNINTIPNQYIMLILEKYFINNLNSTNSNFINCLIILINKLSENDLLIMLELNPTLFKYVNLDNQTKNVCICVIKLDNTNKQFIKH